MGVAGKCTVNRGSIANAVRESWNCIHAGIVELHTLEHTRTTPSPHPLYGAEPGQRLRMMTGNTEPLLAIDLLLEEPPDDGSAEIADYDLETGRLNPPIPGQRMRSVFIRGGRVSDSVDENEEAANDAESCAQFVKCAVCKKIARFGRSYVQDHQTKGDQPFQALVSRQIQIQPPGPVEASSFAPLQGRKVLTFSDSRQVAARLAPNLQLYSDRDSLRPLIAWGYRRLQGLPSMEQLLSLDDLYLAVLLASKSLNVRLRPEIKSGESFNADRIVADAVENGVLKDDAALLTLFMELRTERPPEAFLDNIVTTVRNRFLGFEALALASIVERRDHTQKACATALNSRVN